MGFIALKCPSCGAEIQLDDSRDFGFCTYCGTKIIQDRQIIEHRGSVKVDHSEEIRNLLIRAGEMIKRGAYDEAENYYNRVLDLDISNQIARQNIERLYKIVKEPNLFLDLKVGKLYSKGVVVSIKIDGQKVGNISLNNPQTYTLSVGEHIIEAKINQTFSKAKIAVTINDRFTKCNKTILCKFGNTIEFID